MRVHIPEPVFCKGLESVLHEGKARAIQGEDI